MRKQLPGSKWTLRPEAELLLCCARTRIDSEKAERIRALLADVDWAYLTRTASSHGMLPLLYWSLNATCPEAVPEATLNQLRDDFWDNAGHNLFLTDELLKLLNLLEEGEIPAIPFKGPTLAAFAYGNLALRQSGDLDILVRERDILNAKDLIISRGYQPLTLTDAHAVASVESQRAYTLVREDFTLTVDLHWGLTPEYFSVPFEFVCLQEHLKSVCLAGTTVLSLAEEDLLLILCVHGCKHRWERLAWICDIAELLRARPELDWGEVMKQADALGSGRMLALGLVLATDLLGADLPAKVLEKVQAYPGVRSLAMRIRQRLFREADDSSRGMWAVVNDHSLRRRALEHLSHQVQYSLFAARCIMTPNVRDRALLALPAPLSFLYYLIRPMRLIIEYYPSPSRRFFHRKTT